MENRIRASINALRSQSAWSPMPEHLMFAQLKEEKSPTPITPDGESKCDECGMKFKSEAMLTYHKVGFCVGPPTDESLLEEIQRESSYDLPDEFDDMQSLDNNKNTTLSQSRKGRINAQKPSKLEWCMCAHGAVAPAAVKVGYDDSDLTYTYACVAQVGDEVIPGTVLPPRKHATVVRNGNEIKTTDYSVLIDLEGLTTWRRCETAGGIPCGAIRGGHDSDQLQYFIARGKAPDNNWCCGQYIPHKQQCFFAWEGTEYKTKDFEVLCKAKTKNYFGEKETKTKTLEVKTLAKPRQPTETVLQGDKTVISDSKEIMKSENQNNNTNQLETPVSIKTGGARGFTSSTIKTNRQDTGIISPRKTDTPGIVKSGTEVRTQAKHDSAASGNSILKEKSKITNPRERTKSVVSKDKSTLKEKSKINNHRELTKSDSIKEQYLPKERSRIANQHNVSKEKSRIVNQYDISKEKSSTVNQHDISKEKSRIIDQHDISKEKSGVVNQHDISKEKSRIVNQHDISKEKSSVVNQHDISKEKSRIVNEHNNSKENRRFVNKREITTSRDAKESVSKEKSKIMSERELTRSATAKEFGVLKEKTKVKNIREITKSDVSEENGVS